MNIEIGGRLKAERQRIGVAPTEFATLCGVSRTTQFNYEAGDRAPDADYLQRAHEAGIDVQYVVTGNKAECREDFVVVPQYDVAASAGAGALNGTEITSGGLSFSRHWLAERGLNPSSLKVINISGESMLPRLSDGDKVLVDVSDTAPKSGRTYVLLQGEELLVKHCQLLPDGLLRVSSSNSDYPTYDIDLSKTHGVLIVGRVRVSTHEW